MLIDINPHLKNQGKPLLDAIHALVRIPSVFDENAAAFPFGKSIDEGLRP